MMVISTALEFVPGCTFWCSAVFNAAVGYATTGSLRGAFVGAVASYMSPAGYSFAAIMIRAYIGGVASVAMGGQFRDGAIAYAAAGGTVGKNATARIVTAAFIGGSVSVVTGGKFVNGAATAAFAAALSEGLSNSSLNSTDEEVAVTADCSSIRCEREGDGWKQLGRGKIGEVEWTGSDIVSDPETDALMIKQKEAGNFEHSRRKEHGSTGRLQEVCDASGCTPTLVITTDNRSGTADSTRLPNRPTDTWVQHSHPRGSGSANKHFGPGDHIFLTKGKVNYLLNSSGDLMVLEAHSGRIWERTLTGRNAGNSEVWIRRMD